MAQTIKLKRSAVAGRIPTLNSLDLGEVAINTTDGKMYMKKSVSGVESIVEITAAQLPADPTFDSVTLTGAPGPIEWNADESTVDVPLNSDVTLQLGQETLFYAKATEAISNGDVVMFAGAQGDHLMVSKADMSLPQFEPEYVIGIATQDFALNDFGFVTTFGKVRGLNTAQYTEGDVLYLDPSVSGGLTTTRPTPTNHIIQMCAVTRSHITEGTFLVRPTHFHDTDEVPEGTSNLYFTDARAVSAVATADQYVKNTGDTINGNLNVVGDLYITASGDDGWRFRPGANSGFQYGFADQHGNAQVFTNEQGTVNQAFILGDTNPDSPSTLFGVSVVSGGSNPTTGSEAWTKKLNLTGAGDLYIGSSGTSKVWHEGSFNPNNYLLTSNYVDDYVTSATFNTTNGVLTLTRAEGGIVAVDLDGRYLQSETDSQTLSWNGTNGQLSISNGNTVDLDGRYLQSFTETDTLDSVTDRGNTTTNDISVGSITTQDSITFNSPASDSITATMLDGGTLSFSGTSGQLFSISDSMSGTIFSVNDVSGIPSIEVDDDGTIRLAEFSGNTLVGTDVDNGTDKLQVNGSVSASSFTGDVEWSNLTSKPALVSGISHDTVNKELDVTFEDGSTQTVDLTQYIDDTNLARITSGTMNGSGIATFTRDDSSTFTVDMSVLLDDTNLSRITNASWNTGNGVLTLTRNDSSTVTVDLDGRYLQSYSETDTLQSVTNRGNSTTNSISIGSSTTPVNALDVYGGIYANYLRLGSTSSGEGIVRSAGANGQGVGIVTGSISDSNIGLFVSHPNNGKFVGVGTVNPVYRLDIDSGSSSKALGLSLSGTGRLKMYADGTYNYFAGQSGNSHKFTTTGGANVVIQNSGRVGIGTDAPSADLDIQKGSYAQLRLQNPSSSQELWAGSVADSVGSYLQNNAYYATSYAFKPNFTASSGIHMDDDGTFWISTNSGLTPGTNFVPTNRLNVTNTGKVGIGTTTIPEILSVNGYVKTPNLQEGGGITFHNNREYVITATNNSVGAGKEGFIFSKINYAPYSFRWGIHSSGGPNTGLTNFTNLMVLENNGDLKVSQGSVEINEHYTLEVSSAAISSTTQTAIATFPVASFSTAKIIVQAKNTVTGEIHASELLIIHDGTTAISTEYAMIYSGTAPLATYDVDISGSNVRVLATSASTNHTTYKTTKNLIKV